MPGLWELRATLPALGPAFFPPPLVPAIRVLPAWPTGHFSPLGWQEGLLVPWAAAVGSGWAQSGRRWGLHRELSV